MERWFPSPEQQAEELAAERDRIGFEIERAREFLKVPYMADFVKWLTEERRRVEPTVGQPEEMVYRTGVRDGVQLVIDRLDELERALDRRENV